MLSDGTNNVLEELISFTSGLKAVTNRSEFDSSCHFIEIVFKWNKTIMLRGTAF